MVDLVKIRRKAKERKEREEAAKEDAAKPAEDQTPSPSPASPPESVVEAATEATETKSKPSKKKRSRSAVPNASPEPEPASEPVMESGESPPQAEVEDAEPMALDRLDEFRRKAGQRREVLVEESDQEGQIDDQRVELLVFEISRERYAVEIEQIREITRARAYTHVPNADRSVIGIISLRGTIVTILDVRTRLGHRQAAASDDDTRIIVVEQQNEIAGFVVDRVYRVLAIDRSTIEANPVVSPSEQSRYIRGVFRYNDRITILLDMNRLLEQGGE